VDPLDDEMEASIAQLSGLQQLHLDIELLAVNGQAAGAAIPASWSSLASLTTVDLRPSFGDTPRHLLLPPFARLVAVKDLRLNGAACVGGITSLFALTCLTRLEAAVTFDAGDEDAADGGQAGSSRRLVAPQQWRDGLQRLTWSDGSAGSIAMLPQLTSLTFLNLVSFWVSPQLCR
jgi:hypothetical protein